MHSCLFGAVVLCAFLPTSANPSEEIALLQDGSTGPLEKVRKVLQDMTDQLEKDAEEDAEVNEEMTCWCKTEDSKRTNLIADNTEKSGQLREEINSLRAKSDGLSTDLDGLEKELAENQKALDTSIALRNKELNEFTDAERSAMTTIGQLDGAESALKAGLPKAMMQDEVELDAGSPVAVKLKNALHGHEDMLWRLHSRKERKIMDDLLAHSRDISFVQGGAVPPAAMRGINAPFDMIHGTISTLKEAFQGDLKKLQSDELDSSAAHEAAKVEKKEQITAGFSMIQAKRAELADTDQRAAAAREELDDTEDALEGDAGFLKNVKEQCALHAKEYEARKQTRSEETAAVSKAMTILSGDDTKDLFTKTYGHTKRPEEGKLGSRGLKEYKEDRDTVSKRSQTNRARKKLWGTSERYMLLQLHHEAVLADSHDALPEAKKLAALAHRTEAYWKAKYYMKSSEHTKNQVTAGMPAVKQAPKKAERRSNAKSKLGLTAQEMRVRKNQMGAVGQGILKMRKALELQQGEESARKEWCVEEINTVEKQIDITARKKKDLEEKLELGAERIKVLKTELKHLDHEQEDENIELQKASNDRKKSNTAFQHTVNNQLESKRVIQTAMQVLESFYGRREKKASLLRERVHMHNRISDSVAHVLRVAHVIDGESASDSLNFEDAKNAEISGFSKRPGSMLLQGKAKAPTGKIAEMLKKAREQESDAEAMIKAGEAAAARGGSSPKAMLQNDVRPPPPPGFKSYAKGAASGGVLVQLENLIEDTDAMVKEAVEDEAEAMKAYEVYVADANAATQVIHERITTRRVEVGKIEGSQELTRAELKETTQIAATLRQHDIDLYGVEGCSFLIKNYEERFMNRKDEIASLKEAEATLGVLAKKAPDDPEAPPGTEVDPEVEAPLPDPESQAEAEAEAEEEKEAEEAGTLGSSELIPVPEGVKIEGPNGETAVSKAGGAR